MKKFSKILFLLLALVLIVTAFTVVALATEDESTVEAKPATISGWDFTFETYDDGEEIQNSASKKGKFTVISQDDGNNYVLADWETGTGSNAENLDFAYSTRLISDYKYVAMDFDVMSVDGGHSSSIYFRLRKKTGVDSSGNNTFSDLNLMSRIYLSSLGLSSEAYDWQHVTIIVEFNKDSSFSYHVYVDGEFVKTIEDTAKQATIVSSALDEDDLAVNYIRILSQGSASSPKSAFDNILVTHYKEGTSFDDIANYHYNYGDYPQLYKYTVATVTDSESNVSYFDDINKALAAANDGDKVQLFESITDTVIINKAITVDTNIYTTDAETGETTVTGSYTFDWGSTEGYVADNVDGIYAIEKSNQLVTVKWDVPCGAEDCTCVGAHQLSKETIVVIDEIPEYLYDIPEDSEVQGLVTEFLGWSYENDGTVDTLVPITAENVAAGTLNIYPVYRQVQYDLSLNVSGTLTYHTIDEYVTVFDTAEATTGSVVTLLRDAEVYDLITLDAGKTITFDLRGNTITKVYLSGNTFYKNAETGEYDAGEAIATASKNAGVTHMFYTKTKNTGLTVTSSAEEKGTVKCLKAIGDIYYDENGNVEKYEATTVSSGNFLNFYNSANYKLDVSNINIYATRFLYASGGSNSNFKFNVDNCNYYEISSSVADDMKDSYTFYFESNSSFTANITNSLFYYQEGLAGTNVFLRCFGKSGGNHNVTVDNCDIIAMTSQAIFNFYSSNMSTYYLTPDVQYNNCRLYNTTGNDTYTTYLGNDTLYTITSSTSINRDSISTIAEGYVSTPSTKVVQYNVPVSTAPIIDDNMKADLGSDTTTIEIAYTYEVQKCSEVAESITDVRLSMLYYTNFNMMLYIPVSETATITGVSGFTQTGTTVKIEGNEYYVYARTSSTTGVSDTVAAKLTYTVDGETYRQTFNVSALIYADLVLHSPIAEVEAKAVANMVRYIKEARLEASLTAGAEFDGLIALGNLAELGEQADYVDTTVDYSTLAGYVQSVKFMVDGTNAAYVITMTDNAVAAGATVTVSYVGGESITVTESVVTVDTVSTTRYITSGTSVYDVAANAIEITVTVPAETDGAEPTVITGTYSLKAYINATDNALAKAMYEFGIAAKDYREYLIENT